MLPFPTDSYEPNTRLLSTWGSYEEFTIVNYFASKRSLGFQEIGLKTDFNVIQDPTQNLNFLECTLNIVENDLERVFVYKYRNSKKKTSTRHDQSRYRMLEDLTKSKPFDTLAAIGIALPITADWKPSKTKPEILFSNKDAKFFPPNSQLAEADYIWIPYTLTPSIYQERIQRYIYQFILLLVAPFMGLLFINEDDIKKPKARRTIILILSGGAIIAGWFLFGLYKGILGSEGVDMLANLSLAILGAILTPLPAWIKSKKSTS